MASINLGKIAFQWRGAYDAATAYEVQDVVSYNGNSYVCTTAGTGGMPVNFALAAQGTENVSTNAGEVIYNDGTGLAALPAGDAGQVLSISAAGLPEWVDPDIRSATKVKKLPTSASEGGRMTSSYRGQMVIMGDDSIRGWGDNASYKLGDGTTWSRSYPVRPGFGLGFNGADKIFRTYNANVYVIDKMGALWGWGSNSYGELGLGDTTARTIPVNLTNSNPASSIMGRAIVDVQHGTTNQGYNSVAVLDSTGAVHCAGYNGYGQLGDGTTTSNSNFVASPTLTSGVTKIASTSERYTSFYALKSGTVYSWGYNGYGQLADGTTANATIATPRMGGSVAGKTIVDIVGGAYNYVFALADDGSLHAAGYNPYGNLGDGTVTNQGLFVEVAQDVQSIWTGGYDYAVTYIIKTDGTLWGCGYGGYHGHGDSSTTSNNTTFIQVPMPTIGGTAAIPSKVLISGTGSYNCVMCLFTNGHAMTWGYNGTGGCMTGDTVSPVKPTDENIVPTGGLLITDIMAWGNSNENSFGMLMEDGQLFVGGYAGGTSLPEDDSESSYVPMPVIF